MSCLASFNNSIIDWPDNQAPLCLLHLWHNVEQNACVLVHFQALNQLLDLEQDFSQPQFACLWNGSNSNIQHKNQSSLLSLHKAVTLNYNSNWPVRPSTIRMIRWVLFRNMLKNHRKLSFYWKYLCCSESTCCFCFHLTRLSSSGWLLTEKIHTCFSGNLTISLVPFFPLPISHVCFPVVFR